MELREPHRRWHDGLQEGPDREPTATWKRPSSWLREKGLAAAAKKASRIAAEGVVGAYVCTRAPTWAPSSRSTARPTSWPRPTTSRTSLQRRAPSTSPRGNPADVDALLNAGLRASDAANTVEPTWSRDATVDHRREDHHPPLRPLRGRRRGNLHPHGRQGRRAGGGFRAASRTTRSRFSPTTWPCRLPPPPRSRRSAVRREEVDRCSIWSRRRKSSVAQARNEGKPEKIVGPHGGGPAS